MEQLNCSRKIAVHMENISKQFGSVRANYDVNLDVYQGEILALLGENGSGKTTLMNILSGIYFPDKGKICIGGKEVTIASPKDAYDCHIGMIHQHFKLIDVFTSIENIVLGVGHTVSKKEKMSYFFKNLTKKKPADNNKPIDKSSVNDARKIVSEICRKYGFDIELDKKVYDMSVSEKQNLEIVKAIYRGADILILDEPTAVLTPIETERLFDVMRNMRKDGKSVIIITHKLNEVMSISDRVAVLRKGTCIGSIKTGEATESILTEMMVGEKIELNITRDIPKNVYDKLLVQHLSCRNPEGREVLKDVSFTARSGEILGIAGISGSGQKEILESVAGLVKDSTGKIMYEYKSGRRPINLKNKTASQIRELGVRLAFVPEDRLGMGLVGSMDLVDNMMLRSYKKGNPFFVNRRSPEKLATEIIKELNVSTPSVHTSVRKLSGGNVQKVLVGREIASAPKVLMVAYPTRGLDINSSYLIYHLLNEQKKNGAAVVYVGEDLDVLLGLCDRIAVLSDGEIQGILDARTATKAEVGLLMTKKSKENADRV